MTTVSPIGFDNANALLGSFLSNGHFVSLITPAGTGFAICGNVGLTRWGGDFTEDLEGWFIYVRDLESAEYWSVAPPYYDDGAPLGTRTDDECRIDALAQAWSVISKVALPDRARQSLDAVEAYLISDRDKLIRLLTPPFENTPHDPGYIKGYVKGVRENGGQYTHAACWVVRAMAELGRRDRAAGWSAASGGDPTGLMCRP